MEPRTELGPQVAISQNSVVLTIKEVAAMLKLAEKTVYAMANDGELPAFKIRGQWRVRHEDIAHWMQQKVEIRSRSHG